MSRVQRKQLDLPEVTERASALAASEQCAYWIVVSYLDGVSLLEGLVPEAIRQQCLGATKRAPFESASLYAARIAEAESLPAHVKTDRGGLVIEETRNG